MGDIQGFEECAGRLRRPLALELIEISPGRRSQNSDISALVRAEGKQLLAAVPAGWQCDPIALAARFRRWIDAARNAALLVGGRRSLDRGSRLGRRGLVLVSVDFSQLTASRSRSRAGLSCV